MKSKLLLVSMCAFLSFTSSVWGNVSCPHPDTLKGFGTEGNTTPPAPWQFAQWWRNFQPTKESTFILSSTFLYDPGMGGSAWCNYYEATNPKAKKGFALILPLQGDLNSTTSGVVGGTGAHYSKKEQGCKCEGPNCQIVKRPAPINIENLTEEGACEPTFKPK